MKSKRLTVLVVIFAICFVFSSTIADSNFYWPYDNEPPGTPPNYNLVDVSYFQGVPDLPDPFTHDAGGYYIFNDTAEGKWYFSNYLYSLGKSLEQFHGCILVTMEQDPEPNVNIWAKGFELSYDLKQNDRWGWVKWPDEIAPNLYEIWWDITIDYAKKNDTGDYRDTLGVIVAGCATDFNIWSSGHDAPFSADFVFVGDDMLPMSQIPGFTDTYPGITDQYQIGDPESVPNTSRFSIIGLPGATYNVNGLILPNKDIDCTYEERYTGSWVYEANGLQFSTIFTPPNFAPNFCSPGNNDTVTVNICTGESIYDTVTATDPDPLDLLTLSIISGPGALTSTPSTTPVTGYYELSPVTNGIYTVSFEVMDDNGAADTITVNYDVTINTAPVVTLPGDTSVFLCDPAEICLPLEIYDNDCDITSVTTNLGQYSGTVYGYDQVDNINILGGTIVQVGGGYPGKVLYTASDFVPPVNSQSGVSVTLPNFAFAQIVYNSGYFPTGSEPGNSVDYMLGSPTDLTYTLPGTGGPDGGDGDGSVAFATSDYCCLGFNQAATTCNGANVDFMVFTNTAGAGSANFIFRNGDSDVHTVSSQTIPGAGAGTGSGGVTLDLPDGLTFDRVRIEYVSGSFEIDAIAVRSAPSTTASDICFTADTAGVYEITASATDACGNTGSDVTYVTVQLNQPPVADAGSDITLFACDFSEICLDVSFTDPDGNLDYGELYSGPGVLTGDQICFTPTGEGISTFVIRAVDECGKTDFDTVKVTVSKNDPPVANNPTPITKFLCQLQQQCYNFTASDPNGGTLTWSLINGAGNITEQGFYCFTPTASGTYNATVTVTDSCGAADTTWITYNVTINSAPVANDPTSPFAIFQCNAAEICFQFTAADANGGTLTWNQNTGDGTVTSGGLWCFTPTGSGSYSTTVIVTDSCGAADTTDLIYNVTVNDAPTLAFGNDTSLTLCTPQQICLTYEVSDPQGPGGLVEDMVAGFGSIDTANNRVCFTPTDDGSYEFIVGVTDSCGEYDTDTITAEVTFGDAVAIACPTVPVNVSLCEADSVCQLLDITPASATISVSHGVYRDGQLCFYADTSGTYDITVIASDECGADTCEVTFNVDIGQAAQIDCPEAQEIFICEAKNVCIPVGIMGAGTITVSPIGAYNGGNLCFPADTSGHYEITVIASTSCGDDTCLVIADITINSIPVADQPASPVDTFICDPAQICYQFNVTDADGGTLTWSRVSGNGTVSESGLWCFNASAGGTYAVTARVTDSCGAYDEVTLTYDVGVNSQPAFSFGNDISIFACASEMLCLPYTLSDADDNIESIDLIAGIATLYPATSELCFTPAVEGLYQFIVRATDSCGAFDEDTINVDVDFNEAPLVYAGDDQTVFQCEIAEICWATSVSDPDGNLTTVELVSSPGLYDGTYICFMPTSGTMNYEFILKATDDCGAESFDTVVVYYTLNNPPVADAGADQILFQCTPTEICWPALCSDADGDLTSCTLVEGPGDYDGSNICFTPTASGTYTFVLEAVDACAETDRDTAVIDVTVNSAPVCVVPEDTTIFKCSTSEVCLPVYGTDVDDNLDYCQIISGPGTLVGGEWCYMPASNQSVTVVVKCVDDCGVFCESQFTVEFEINESPTISFGSDTTIFLCDLGEICLPYTVYDANDPRARTVTLESGPGTLDEGNSRVCFTPTGDGAYEFIIKVVDECGEMAYDTINVDVASNTPPVADAGDDQYLFLCSSETICWPASCSDADGNLTDCIFNGPGEYTGTEICFTPTSTGNYYFTLQALDNCGEEMTDTAKITVVINTPPGVVFGNDTNVFLCEPEEICVGYDVYDADGLAGVTEHMISGYGVIDTANNRVCFTPTESGTYEIIVGVTDSCTALPKTCVPQVDTIYVTVTLGNYAKIDCPDQPLNVNLCNPDEVCQMLSITPSGATVSASFGSYSGGELCFQADTTGTYNIRVIAEASCGADTCDLVFNVTIGEEPQIDCPAPQSKFICETGDVCIPVGVMGAGATVTVSPIGSYSGGHLCFPADTSGHYELEMIADTDCGADTCLVEVDITINSNPVADNPTTPVDTFICEPTQICYQFTATDIDGGQFNWNRLSGVGTVGGDGLWCFDANGDGTYAVEVVVTDSCGAKDTTSLTYNIMTNSAPVVTLAADETFFLCELDSVCVSYTISDADDNLVTVEIISGNGVLKTAENLLCFEPTAIGSYQFIVEATDVCGASDKDTITITIEENRPPQIIADAPDPLFLCQPQQVCHPVTVIDEDGNLDSAYVSDGIGVYHDDHICFTPDISGTYYITLTAVDECGVETQSTPLEFVIDINLPPVCDVPNDTTFFQCTPTGVSLPVTASDVDDNFDHCEIITGPGSIAGGYWSYAPSTNENIMVVVMCLDACGAYCKDSFNVNFEINVPPVVNAGADTGYFLCNTQTICRDIISSDANGNLMSVELVDSETGTYDYNTGELCFTAGYGDGNDKYYTFIFEATDSCGAQDFDTLNIAIDFNAPPTIEAPPNFVAFLDQVGELCFDVTIEDEDGNLSGVGVSPSGVYFNGQICFDADTTGTYCLEITATDACGLTAVDSVCIEVRIDECIHVQIEKVHNTIQGQYETVDIYLNGSGKEVGGYDLLIAYDASALAATRILPGSLLETCGWEYFNYRFGPDGNCDNGCPTGLLRIVAMAETNNGAYHPGCFFGGLVGTLTSIEFLVSNDRNLECQFVPIRFLWIDCADNTFSSKAGDTLWVAREVYNFELINITDKTFGFPGYFGVPDTCLIGEKLMPMRCIDFINGGIDIICADSIDLRGDINLNGIAYEISDAVMFTNYFVYGLSAFDDYIDGSIAATDVNADGMPLTVADLVYLIRIIVNDAVPYPKPIFNDTYRADFTFNDNILSIAETTARIGALHLVIEGEVEIALHEDVTDMEIQAYFNGENTSVIIYNMQGQAFLEEGPVLVINGPNKIQSVEAGSFDGQVMTSMIVDNLPRDFALSQNYPNPFNPNTTIEFALPEACEWKLTVFNILGQVVETWSDQSNPGFYKLEWDAYRFASGVYFYRLTAGKFSATKKMVLLK